MFRRRAQDVSPPSERSGRKKGSVPLGVGRGRGGCRGEERGRASKFHESLQKLPDTSLGAFLSWTPEEDSSSASGTLRSWPWRSASTPR